MAKEKSKDLLQYTLTEGERFSAADFERNIDRNLKQARQAFQESQANYRASLNDRVREQYSRAFEDPTRVPWFDEKAGVWELSSKFKVEDNDDPDYLGN
jgi:hypothetical protein